MQYITAESDSRWIQKRIFDIPDGSFVVEEGLFLVDVLTVKMAVYLQQIFGDASVNSFLSLSRNYFSINQRQDKEYVCFGKYNTSLIP